MDSAEPPIKAAQEPGKRSRPTAFFANEARRKGYQYVAGIDEVGRGPLAGPVVAAAVILPIGYKHPFLDDSKRVLPHRRKEVRLHLQNSPGIQWAIGEASVEEIDQLNIYHASLLAMRRAMERLAVRPHFLLIDGNRGLRTDIPERPIIGGDGRCSSIAAASILAKEHRDEIMVQLDQLYPLYGFARHKGYGTQSHWKILDQHGPSPIHRRTFLARLRSEADSLL